MSRTHINRPFTELQIREFMDDKTQRVLLHPAPNRRIRRALFKEANKPEVNNNRKKGNNSRGISSRKRHPNGHKGYGKPSYNPILSQIMDRLRS